MIIKALLLLTISLNSFASYSDLLCSYFDFNNDKYVNEVDGNAILKKVLVSRFPSDEFERINGDLNVDGIINPQDASLLLRLSYYFVSNPSISAEVMSHYIVSRSNKENQYLSMSCNDSFHKINVYSTGRKSLYIKSGRSWSFLRYL